MQTGFFSWEFILYYLVLLYAFLHVVHEGIALSALLDDRTPGVIGLQKDLKLEPGWFQKRYLDLSDYQWKQLRESAFGLGTTAVVFLVSSRAVACFAAVHRLQFYALSGTVYAGLAYGSSAYYLLLALAVNYLVARALAGRPQGFWVLAILNATSLVLTGISYRRQYGRQEAGGLLSALGTWQGSAAFLALRSLSFFTCLHSRVLSLNSRVLSLNSRVLSGGRALSGDPRAAQPPGPVGACEGAGKEVPGFWAFAAYSLYPPLLAAGPLMPFSDFLAASSQPPPPRFFCFSPSQALRWAGYGARLALLALLLEVLSHVLYFTALARSGMWRSLHRAAGIRFRDADLFLTAFWVALVSWLKFLVMWRGARLVALLDGLEPPENVRRCPFNLLTAQELWANWNASLHACLQQLVEGPLGTAGPSAKAVGLGLAAALWYFAQGSSASDLLMIALFLLPLLAGRLLLEKRSPLDHVASTWYYRHVLAAGYAIHHVLMAVLITALYVTGAAGVLQVFEQLVKRPLHVCVMWAVFFCMAHVSLEIRAKESDLHRRLVPLG